ncbi:MAG: ParB N-terminal domain-containing protein [Pyrinomonadaceae bacterium]
MPKPKTKPEPTPAALFPETAPEVEAENLPIGLIECAMFGADPGADLVASVKRVGILVPVIVQRVAKGKEAFTLVDGRRRLKAAQDAGLDFIPARILPEDVDNPEAFTLQANMTRRANPVSEYVAIRDLIAKGYGEKEIVKTLGIKAAVLAQRLLLAKLIPTLYDLLESGLIGVSVGEAAAKLPVALQEGLLDVFAKDDRLTLKDVSEAKRVRREEKTASLSDLIFGPGEKTKTDARAALSHLDAVQSLLESLGERTDADEVNFESIRKRLDAYFR